MPRKIVIPEKPYLKAMKRKLQNHSTLSEAMLWEYLKDGQLHGCDFKKQKRIMSGVVHFYCAELKLAIGIDGSRKLHEEEPDENAVYHALQLAGHHVIRIDDLEVKRDAEGVAKQIRSWIDMQRGAVASITSTGDPS